MLEYSPVPDNYPQESPPDIGRLIEVLALHGIKYVVVGSYAAMLYGARLEPGDFDIVPALDKGNLNRLAETLRDIGAVLPETDETGWWEIQADGEKRWVSRKATEEERRQRADWRPNPEDPSTFDHLFHTHLGNFDVVPEVCGTFEVLQAREVRMTAFNHIISVAHVDDLLAALTIPRREKYVKRVRALRGIQRQRDDG